MHVFSYAQTISPYLAGQNAWLPYAYGNEIYGGSLDQLWSKISDSKVKFIRVGGIAPDFSMPTNQQYLALVDSIRKIGAEPLIQVPYGRGKYNASNAAAIVNYLNNTMGRNVKYWTIANEPNLPHDSYAAVSVGTVESYIKSYAPAMKSVDPSIFIVGPDCAWYDVGFYDNLIGGSNDITGRDTNGRFYIDIVSFHSYPFDGNQSRADVINQPSTGFEGAVKALIVNLNKANAKHGRNGASALRWALTEFNINYRNPTVNNAEGVGVHSFLNGQFFAEYFGIGMKYEVFTMMPWSVHESQGARGTYDLGYLDNNTTFNPRAYYYHEMMISEHFKGSVLASSDNHTLIKTFASADANQISVLILNQELTRSFNAGLRFDEQLINTELAINANVGLGKAYYDVIPAQSTVLLVFSRNGELIKKIFYSVNQAINSTGPVVTASQSPYGSTAAIIPGTVQAENYDLGGQNIAFYDNTVGNTPAAYRAADVDIEATTDMGGGYNVGYTADGEWLEYTVNVTQAGNYTLEARVASVLTTTGQLTVMMDGVNVSGPMMISGTGGWQTWQTVKAPSVYLTAGQKVMRVNIVTSGFNLNHIKFVPVVTNQAPTVSLTAPANNASFTAPATIAISVNAADSDGSIARVEFFNGTTLLNTDVTAPYAFSWTNVAAGSYSITARATDNAGATTISAIVSVTVITATAFLEPFGSTKINGQCLKINGMYVDDVFTIVGNTTAETALLNYARNNGVNYLLFYSANQLVSGTRAAQFAALIRRAKTQFGIQQIGAICENAAADAPLFVTYNNGRSAEEKIDVFNLEFEFWAADLGALGYCDYLASYGACNRANAFRFYIDQINALEALGTPQNVETEVYIGWATDDEARQIANAVDRVLIHAYRQNDVNIIGYTESRLRALGSGNKRIKLAPIFSSEGPQYPEAFMGTWLATNPKDRAFETWLTGYNALTGAWKNNIEIVGQSWYSYIRRTDQAAVSHITGQPADLAACTGQTRTFTVASSATNVRYNWMRNGRCLSDGGNIAGSNSATLTISNIGNADVAFYSCRVVSNDANNPSSFVSNNATLSITTNCVTTQSPYGGSPANIPGTIQTENYDLGGQGIAINETTPTNLGGAYRATEAVDIEPTTSGGFNVGYIVTNEWLEYTVNATAGNYKIDARVAAMTAGQTFRVELDGATIATFTVPNTGGWQTWQTVSVTNVAITAGQKIMRLFVIGGDFNIDNIVFSSVVSNQSPVVSLTSPTNNASYATPASIYISATASDADGSITRVEFFNGTTLLNSDASAPYTFTWTNVAAGSYTITARATDNTGAVATSNPVTLTVSNAADTQAPRISLTSPTNAAVYNAPANISMAANASDNVGVTRVEFYNGTTLLNSDTSSPYAFSWTNIAAGSYSITAKAFDAAGNTTTSAVASISVNTINTNACTSIAQYTENGGYAAGSRVQNAGSQYQCKPFPFSGWCNGAAWAYAPGTGIYWNEAWTLVGMCNARTASKEAIVNELMLSNHPNPFDQQTTIEISVMEAGPVSVIIYNKTGQVIQTIVDQYLNTGNYNYTFDGSGLNPDMYVIKMKNNNEVATRKIIKTN